MNENFNTIVDIAKNIFQNRIDEVNKYLKNHSIAFGIVSPNNSKRSALKKGIKIKFNNAQILKVNEFGSADGRIPSRPVLKLTYYYAQFELIPKMLDNIKKIIFSNKYSLDDIILEIERTCIRIQSFSRELISRNDGTFLPNALSTQIAKGKKINKHAKPPILVNHPLFDTGQLSRSIKCMILED